MTTLTQYSNAASNLPEGAFLGKISYFTISEGDVELEAVREQLVNSGLSDATLRKRLRPIDAFKKAANEFAIRFDKQGNEHHSILVRQVGQDAVTSHRHVVLERAIYNPGSRRKLAYDNVATLVYDREENTVTATRMTPIGYTYTAEEQAHIDAALAGIEDRFKHWCTHLDAHAVRTFVREYMYQLGGISIRQNGGFYFVQQKHADELEKLGAWVKSIGSAFHTIPLLDIVDQREMLVEAFEAETIEQVDQMTGELAKILRDPQRTITPETYDAYATKASDLIAKCSEYSDLLDRTLETASDRLHIFKAQTLTLATRVRVPKNPSRKKLQANG